MRDGWLLVPTRLRNSLHPFVQQHFDQRRCRSHLGLWMRIGAPCFHLRSLLQDSATSLSQPSRETLSHLMLAECQRSAYGGHAQMTSEDTRTQPLHRRLCPVSVWLSCELRW